MSTRYHLKYINKLKNQDDKRLFQILRDFSGGMNTRTEPSRLPDKQASNLENVDIGTLGQVRKRPGSVQIADDMGSSTPVALCDYERQGYTDQLLIFEDDNLNASAGEGNHTEIKGDFTASQTDIGMVSAKESGITPDDVVFINVGENNWWRINYDSTSTWNTQDLGNTSGTGSDSPPSSTVGAWYGNRFWVLVNDLLYFSDAYSADYSAAFDTTTDSFRIPVGEERAIIPTRTEGLIIAGEKEIWSVNPSATPNPTSDKPIPIVASHGFVSKNGYCEVGGDVFYFAQDGVRSLKRTEQDKLQQKASLPLSYPLKDEYDEISWANIDQLSMAYFDNKIFVSVPTSASEYKIWVYYPAHNGWIVIDGWNARSLVTHKISGEERLYYGKQGDGLVYRAWYGYTDEGTTTTDGTAVSSIVETRGINFQKPLVKKRGGEVELEANASGGTYSLTIKAKLDDGNYSDVGVMDLSSDDAPTLPVDLPFTLAEDYKLRDKYPLGSFGDFRSIQFKVTNSDTNNVNVKLYGINAVTFQEEYENE